MPAASIAPMKIEPGVDSPRKGVIGEVGVVQGERVVEGAVLAAFAHAGESGRAEPRG